MNKHILNYFAAILILCAGDKEADSELQKNFGEFDGILADMRDHCLNDTSIKIADLKKYKNADDIPENELCFYKCFYEQLGLLDGKGNLVMQNMNDVIPVKDLDEDAKTKLKTCLQGVDQILVCTDFKHVGKCLDEIGV